MRAQSPPTSHPPGPLQAAAAPGWEGGCAPIEVLRPMHKHGSGTIGRGLAVSLAHAVHQQPGGATGEEWAALAEAARAAG